MHALSSCRKVHLVFRSVGEQKPEQLLGDFKRFTSKAIVKAIINNPRESSISTLLNDQIEMLLE